MCAFAGTCTYIGTCTHTTHTHAHTHTHTHTHTLHSEWLVNQHRDSFASYIGHPNLMEFFAVAENESKARVKFNFLQVLHTLYLHVHTACIHVYLFSFLLLCKLVCYTHMVYSCTCTWFFVTSRWIRTCNINVCIHVPTVLKPSDSFKMGRMFLNRADSFEMGMMVLQLVQLPTPTVSKLSMLI